MKNRLFPLTVVVMLAACSGEEGRNKPFASVNGTPVTYGQLEVMTEKFGLDDAPPGTQAEAERKLKEMLISTRAMALLAEKSLSEEEKEKLQFQVAAYREEILVKKYLEANATPEPVSGDAVKAYYDKHPEEFGGGKEKEFEILSTLKPLTGTDRDTVLRQFAQAAQSKDWNAIARKLSELGVSYKRAKSRPELLDNPLKQLVTETGAGKISNVHVGNELMIVRVVGERGMPPKPLMEVSADIRKKLAPNQLKQAIKKLSDEALKKVEVKYKE